MTTIIKIDLPQEDAELFKIFRKYQNDILFLINSGVMDLEEGQIIINKSNKVIKGIDFKIPAYRRKST